MSRTALLRSVAGAAGAMLAYARPARAQAPANAQSFCVPTLTGACFAFAITDAATGFDVWLRNLSAYGDDVVSPFAVRQFAIERVNAPGAGGARTDLAAGFANRNVAVTGSALRGDQYLDENTYGGEFSPARTLTYSSVSYGLLGCALPPEPLLAGAGFLAITCADRGLDGWLRVGFDARVVTERPASAGADSRTATAADVAVEVAGCLTHLGAASGVTGPFGGAAVCASAPFPAAVVPEPATAWTVAAGLGGVLAAAGARRGRRP